MTNINEQFAAGVTACGTFACPVCGRGEPHSHTAGARRTHEEFKELGDAFEQLVESGLESGAISKDKARSGLSRATWAMRETASVEGQQRYVHGWMQELWNFYIAGRNSNIPTPAAERVQKDLADMHHDLIVVMQTAWIDWQRGEGAESAMQWIENTLVGPGLIPDESEPYSSEPQAYFDKNKANPFPECFCGRPSNQLWMGKGFCGNAHYDQHRAAILASTSAVSGGSES